MEFKIKTIEALHIALSTKRSEGDILVIDSDVMDEFVGYAESAPCDFCESRQWISVFKALPDDDKMVEVLAYISGEPETCCAHFNRSRGWWVDSLSCLHVSHWREACPLPPENELLYRDKKEEQDGGSNS